MNGNKPRIGIFGGTFDPIHNGHLAIAQKASEVLDLEWTFLVPAKIPPNKRNKKITSSEHRLAMLKLATEDNTRLRVSKIELLREGISYTIDTVRSLKTILPGYDLVLIMGGDSLLKFEKWRSYEDIMSLASVAVASRPGGGDHFVPSHKYFLLPDLEWGISSTMIRTDIELGQSCRYMVPDKVLQYIKENDLYANRCV